ncbi:unnamed protein product [marine sediment metagenome]|uniref:Uncharacterized protein n=1 Tax=marine sediment metagenome TaxID=412755 RepID=X1J824_9ZZZZ
MRKVVRTDIGNEQLSAVVENGEVTGYHPINIRHLNKDILGCVTYIVLIGNAITKTKKVELEDARG